MSFYETFHEKIGHRVLSLGSKVVLVLTILLSISIHAYAIPGLMINDGDEIRLSDHPEITHWSMIIFTSDSNSDNPGILIIDENRELSGTFSGSGYAVFRVEEGVTLNVKDKTSSAFRQNGNISFIGSGRVLFEGNEAASSSGAVQTDGSVTFGDNATLTGNETRDSGSKGGAVYAGDNVTFGNNAILTDNVASGGSGGAVYSGGIIIFRDNATLTGNAVSINGGAVYAENGSVIFGNNVTLTENIVYGGDGGAVYANGSVTLGDNATLTSNAANSSGGAVYASGDVSFGDNAVLTGNEAGSLGGAVWADGSVEFGDNATLIGNTATYSSGGAVRAMRNVTFGDNTTLSNNTAGVFGGAVFALRGNVTFGDNATLTGNTADDRGGAVYSYEGNVTFGDNATLTGNTSGDSGGAVYAVGDVTFGNNTTLTGNRVFGDGSGGAVLARGNVTFNTSDGGYSLISGNLASMEEANSIFFLNFGSILNLNINTVGNSSVDLRDPVSRVSTTVDVNKTGSGTWLLGGSNDFGGAVNITEGTLHLYAADEVSNGYKADGTTEKNVEAGEIIASSFTLADGAALTAGGGNKITAANITLEGGITINSGTLELDGAVTSDNLDLSFGEGAELLLTSGLSAAELSGDNAVLDLGANTLTAQSGTFAGVITAGSLVKEGEEQLYLSTANAFGGDITINNGTLRLNTNTLANSLSGAGTLLIDLGNPAEAFSLTDSSGTFTGMLDLRNTGFTFDDTAEAILTDATLSLGTGSSTSADQLRTIGGLDMNGGTLVLDYGTGIVDSFMLNVGTLNVTGGTVNILGETPIPFDVTVQDSLFDFTVEQGIKIADAQTVTGSSQLNVLVNGEEQAAGVFDVVQNGETVGEGLLGLAAAVGDDGLYLGGGLTGVSANDGKTIEISNEGAETDTFSARLTGQGGFAFDLTEGSTVSAGNVSSDYSGSTFINGAGTFRTLADNTFGNTDSVSVGSGAGLVLNHEIGSADINIAEGSYLGGNGSTGGDVSLYGTIAPGNSIGTLTVGSISFEDGSVYEVEANIDGSSDKIIVTGNAVLTGGSVSVLAENGNWGASTQFSILEAGSITGEFESITSNLAFLTPSLSYSTNEVNMALTRNDIGLSDVAFTRNQRSVSGAINSLAAGNGIYDSILVMDEDSARRAYDGLSGEIHATAISSILNNGRLIRSTVNGRLTDVSSAKLTNENSAWVKIFGLTADTDTDGNAAKYDSDGQLFIGGIDFQPAAASRFGLAFGYEASNIKVKNGRSSEADMKAIHLGAYGLHRLESVELRAGAFFGFYDMETTRRVRAGDINEKLESDYNAKSVQAFVEAGKSISFGRASVTPYINTAYTYLHADSASENGGEAALEIDSYDEGLTTASAGVRGEIAFTDALRIRGNAAYQRALDGDKPERELRFVSGGGSFDVRGLPLNEDSLIIGLDLGYSLSKAVVFSIGYGGSFGKYVDAHHGKASVSVTF